MSGSIAGAVNGGVPFTEQAEALRQRIGTLLPSDRWTDTLGEINNWGFAVAGAKKESLLQSLGQALLETQADGRDARHFQRQFAAIVAREGWTYRGPIGWRARVIFETNLGQSREAGKWRQIAEAERDGRDFWVRYVATMDAATRPQHAAWNGVTLRASDRWWRTHAPKNGWGCRCTVLLVSPGLLRREGWTVSDQAPEVAFENRQVNTASGPQTVRVPQGIDTGFGHNPGQRPLDGVVPRPAGEHPLVTLRDMTGGDDLARPRILGGTSPKPPLPDARPVAPGRILPPDLPPAEYARRFLAEFGATPEQPAGFRDVVGSSLAIGLSLFEAFPGGPLKVTKSGRAPTILLAADAIRDPDEIWAMLEATEDRDGKPRVRLVRHYIARFVSADRLRSGFAVFRLVGGAWEGLTAYEPSADRASQEPMDRALERRRQGILIYRRGE